MAFAFLISSTLTTAIISAISAILGALLGTGGVYALLKIGPERDEIKAKVTKQLFIDTAGLLVKDLREECKRLNEEIAQLKMENIEREHEHQSCQDHLRRLQFSITVLQEDLQRIKNKG